MKRICIVLSLILLFSFTACAKREIVHQESTEPVTLTVLIEDSSPIVNGSFEKMFQQIYGEHINLEFIELPSVLDSSVYVERTTSLTNLRAEIMAGKGPDIFILPTWSTSRCFDENRVLLPPREPLFNDIYDAMNNGIFLSLDDMIDRSDSFNIENHVEIIMNEGKTSEGQVVLPLLYSFNLNLLDRTAVENSYVTTSIDDVIVNGEKDLIATLQNNSFNWVHSIFPDIVDYNDEKLILSEQDIYETLNYVADLFDVEPGYGNVNWDFTMKDDGNDYLFFNEWNFFALKNYTEEITPVSIKNTDGGLTATITAYAAINRNTEHPEEAFKVIEFMFRDEIQGCKGVRVEGSDGPVGSDWCPSADMYGFEEGIPTGYVAYDYDIIYDREMMNKYVSSINSVRFISELDWLLCDTWYNKCWSLQDNKNRDDLLQQMAMDLYSDWRMMVAE